MRKNKHRHFPNKNQSEENKYSQTEPLLREGQFQELEQGNLPGSPEKGKYYADTRRSPPPRGMNRDEGDTFPQKGPENKTSFEEGEGGVQKEENKRKLNTKRKKAA